MQPEIQLFSRDTAGWTATPMSHFDFPETIVRLVYDALCYPVRDRHPLIVLAYSLALIGGIILVCALIATLIPDSPFR